MPPALIYVVLIGIALIASVLVYVPRNQWLNLRILQKEGKNTLVVLGIGMGTSILCFLFSKLLFSALCLVLASNIVEYTILVNNVYWSGSELLSPIGSFRYPLSYFGLHTLSYFAGMYAVLYCLSKVNIKSSYNLSNDRLKLQFMCLGLFLFFEVILYVSYPFQTFASGWRIFHNFFAVFLARIHFTACLFIAAWLHFHSPWIKTMLNSKILAIRVGWLERLFQSPRNRVLFFIGLGMLFLFPAYLRMYATSSLGLFFSICINGTLLVIFWYWVSPTLYQIIRFIIDFEKRKIV